jgi:hypothetical protein
MKKTIISEQSNLPNIEDLLKKYKCPFLIGGTETGKTADGKSFIKRIATQKSRNNDYDINDILYIKNDFTFDVVRDDEVINENVPWACDAYTQTKTYGEEQDTSQLSPDQQTRLELKKSEGWSDVTPIDYEDNKNLYEIFRGIPGVTLYRTIAFKNMTRSQIESVLSTLSSYGYTPIVPAFGSREYNQSRVSPKTLANFITKDDARELGIRDLNVKVYPLPPQVAMSRRDARRAERKRSGEEKKYRLSSTECQQNIERLYYSLPMVTKKPRGFVALIDQTELNSVKDKVRSCIANEGEDGFTIMRGYGRKTDEMVAELLRNPDPKFGLKPTRGIRREQTEDTLKSVIRESLINFGETKKKTLTEEKNIVNNRFRIIAEGRNLKSKKEQKKIGYELVEEVFYLKSQGFDNTVINESIFDFFKSILGHSPDGVVQFFKEKLADKILSALGVDPKGWIGGTISTAFGNLPITEMGKLVSDCSFTTKLISKSIAEESLNQLKEKVGKTGGLYDILSNTVVEALEQNPIAQSIEEKLGDIICPIISSVGSKLSKTETELKEKVFS